MNSTGTGSARNEKVQMIIEASQRRFGLYGIEKTSMREIADDLKLSKASLYYYFPDKESLYKAVVEKEYFRSLLNLSRLRLDAYSGLKPGFLAASQIFKEKEKEIIIKIFKKGITTGIFFIKDTDQMATLYLDLLRGLRITLINEKETLFIEQQEYDLLLEKTIAFTNFFIKGLKCK
jgi:AcrR family transcriptional regulator